MKQLLHCCVWSDGGALSKAIAVALHNQAFLIVTDEVGIENTNPSRLVVSLQPPATTTNGEHPAEIQAITVTNTPDLVLWCAVTRADKSLALYQVMLPASTKNEHPEQRKLPPTTLHRTPKRCPCLAFAHLSDTVIVTGDVIGDVHAYSITLQQDRGKLLLGHTASMLTSLRIDPRHGRILTSDRDEKIRVSAFPNTHQIEGFLLGHTTYVTCIDVSTRSMRCVSASGDGTIRLWDYDSFQELASRTITCPDTSTTGSTPIPFQVSLSPDGSTIAVLVDKSRFLQIFQVVTNESNVEIRPFLQHKCPAQPLSVSLVDNDHWLVLLQEPHYLAYLKRAADGNVRQIATTCGSLLQQMATGIVLPDSLMEKDNHGQLVVKKSVDTRGPAAKAVWNRTERIQIAKERERRSKRRKQSKRRERKCQS